MYMNQSHTDDSSIALDEFRGQIEQFKRIGVVPYLDDLVEKDAIISALLRIDPTLPPKDAQMHANIIIREKMTSPKVTAGDISKAMDKLYDRQESLGYQVTYAIRLLLAHLSMERHIHVPVHFHAFEKAKLV